MSLQPGEILAGKYQIERILGEGGMGIVVVATHIGFDDRVAIKFLLPEIAQNRDVVARFLREGRASRKIQSEHVVRVSDLGTLDNGAPYMVMEYLDGIDLAQHLTQHGPLTIADALEYVLQACEALAEAHMLGVVHRDLKPANLFLTKRRDRSPCVKVLDFGISKTGGGGPNTSALTKTGGMMGSPLYMSPEQLESARDVDARADIWALGIILYELLAGTLPFEGDTLPQLSIAIMMKPPIALATRRPDVPPELQAVIEQCLAKDREVRFQNVGALATALASFAPATAKLSIDRIVRIASSPTERPIRVEDSKRLDKTTPMITTQLAARGSGPPVATQHAATTMGPSTVGRSVSAQPAMLPRRSVMPWLVGGTGVVAAGALAVLLVTGRRNDALPPTVNATTAAPPVKGNATPPVEAMATSASAVSIATALTASMALAPSVSAAKSTATVAPLPVSKTSKPLSPSATVAKPVLKPSDDDPTL